MYLSIYHLPTYLPTFHYFKELHHMIVGLTSSNSSGQTSRPQNQGRTGVAIEPECPLLAEFPLVWGNTLFCFSLRPSTDCTKHSHIDGGSSAYTKSADINVTLSKIPSQHHPDWCLIKHLGAMAQPSRHIKLIMTPWVSTT